MNIEALDAACEAQNDSMDSENALSSKSEKKARAMHPNCTTLKYNRKCKPGIDKRRTYRCGYVGKFRVV